MDHAYITGVGLLLILVDSFSDWPEVIRVPNKKNSSIKQILRIVFSRNGIPKTQVSHNAPGLCDEDLNLGLEKIGCKPHKTLPYHPQSNGLAERIVQTVKTRLKACSQQREKIVFLPGCFLIYRTIPYAEDWKAHQQIRALRAMSYSAGEKV